MPLFQGKNANFCRFFNAKIVISAVFSKKNPSKLPLFQSQMHCPCTAFALPHEKSLNRLPIDYAFQNTNFSDASVSSAL